MLRALAVLSMLSGCIDDRDVQLPDEPVQSKTEMFEIPQASPPPLDVLFVVDNGPAMAPYEATIAENLPAIAEIFEANLGWWDRHLGVVTADAGCEGGGSWRHGELTNGQFFIDWRHLDDTRSKNFDGTLVDHLPGLLAAGHDGCGEHRPLDAIMAALATPFRRDDADLIIVVIGASDDHSTITVDEALAQIRARSTREGPLVIAIAPDDAERLHAFAHDDRRTIDRFAPITANDVLQPFVWLGHGDWWGGSCLLSTLVDRDPGEAFQPSCAISDLVRDRETNAVLYDRPLPACTGGNRPCWRFERDLQNCPYDSGYTLKIDRVDFPPMGTMTVGQCEVAETP